MNKRIKDITGFVFGELTVLKMADKKFHSNIGWTCQCSCGVVKDYNGQGLRKGETKHCGCMPTIKRGPKDISGQKFGRLLAIKPTGEMNKGGNFIWEFLCDCGNTTIRPSGGIIFGSTQSCGCFSLDSPNKGTHKMSKTKEYKSWTKIKERVFVPSCKSYPDYGGSGITMGEEFVKSFENFIEHVGLMPRDGVRYTIGRIDNSLGYVKGNMQWETDIQQARNKGKQVNNSSGFHGVSWDNKLWPNGLGSTLYAKVQWRDLDSTQRTKAFSVTKYGLLPAFKMACEYREEMIIQLNLQGAGYTETHGK